MSGLKKFDIDPADLDADGIAESQAVVVGTTPNLVLNGALCVLGTAAQFDIGDAYSAGVVGVRLLFDSAGDINTNVFTITGKDQDGNSVTETVTGVTTTAVSTVKYYSQVTAITASIDTTSNVFVGTVTGALVSKTVPVNRLSDQPAAVAVSGLSGTCQFDLEQTFDDMRTTTGDSAAWFVVSTAGTDASTDIATLAAAGATAVRCKFDSYTNGAELQFHVSYNPYR
jgi:hypothetical protein